MAKRFMAESREVFRSLDYGRVSASTQNQALSALLFFYKKILKINLPFLDEIVRAKRLVPLS